jgi:cytochrome P450
MKEVSPTWYAETFQFVMEYLTPNEPQSNYREKFGQNGVVEPKEGVVLAGSRAAIAAVTDLEGAFSSGGALRIGNQRPNIPMQTDPPEHAKYRKLLDHLFSPKRMKSVEAEIVVRANSLIDAFVDRDECNFTKEFAEPFPGMVFLDLMGLPQSDRPALQKMADAIFHPGEGITTDVAEIARIQKEGGQAIYDYFESAIEERRKSPREDVISGFIEAEIDGRPLTTEEMLDMCFTLVVGGLDTVKGTLTQFMAFLGQNPSHRQRLVDEPGVIPQAIEELLRWETPAAISFRRSTKDQEVLGCPIKEDQVVIMAFGAANVDPEAFPDGMTVDFDRKPNRHVAFGSGIHRCLGSHLARRELLVALQEWHRRIPNWSLKPGTNLTSSMPIRVIDGLELVW